MSLRFLCDEKKNKIKIRKFVKEDALKASQLIIRTFQRFVSDKWGVQARQKFHILHSPLKLIELSTTSDVFIAEGKGKIVGVAILQKDRLRTLFVDQKFHGRGIASFLLDKIERLARRNGFKKVKVRSSLYACSFYQKQGYKKSTGIIKAKGAIFQPMLKVL